MHLTLKRDGYTYLDWPFNILDPAPFLLPLMGFEEPAGPYIEGWALTDAIFIVDDLAQVDSRGINLRELASGSSNRLGIVPGGTIIKVTGSSSGEYTPVRVAVSVLADE